MGFMPRHDEFDRYMKHSDKVLIDKKDYLLLCSSMLRRCDSANLLFSVATFMWCTPGTFSAGS